MTFEEIKPEFNKLHFAINGQSLLALGTYPELNGSLSNLKITQQCLNLPCYLSASLTRVYAGYDPSQPYL